MSNAKQQQPDKRRKQPRRTVEYIDGRINGPEMLTFPEVCGLFDVSRYTIDRWRRDLRFPARIIGHVVRFPRRDLEAWLANQRG
jgi:excisionase family DNA binding protein